jgi:hypothetical protein
MKKFFSFLVFSLVCVALANAQTQIPQNLTYTFPAVTSAVPLTVLQFSNQGARPSNYTIDASVNGTVPTACTFRVEGSSDNATWYGLDVTSPATNSCTVAYMEHIVSKPVLYLRINVVSYTAGDGTTRVIFHYTGKP